MPVLIILINLGLALIVRHALRHTGHTYGRTTR